MVKLFKRPSEDTKSSGYHVDRGSKNGVSNGLSLTLDTENFNFAYHRAVSQGLVLFYHSFNHHLQY